MTTVRDLHDKAMLLAEKMLADRLSGQHERANRLATAALEAELSAARLAFDRKVSAATRLILLKSAANLAREAKLWDSGMDLAIRALGEPDLRDFRSELFRIIDTLRTYEHLQVIGIELSDADIQLAMAGPEAAPGFARAEEVTRRVEHVRALMVRSAMRRAGIPFEATSPRTREYRQTFTPYLSQARAASYAITLRFGVNEQTELELADGSPRPILSAKEALDDVLSVAKAYAKGGPEELYKVIPDVAYAKSTAVLLRHLSPDTERVSTVGLTVYREGKEDPIALPPRTAFDVPATAWLPMSIRQQALPPRRFEIVGRLLEGSAKVPTKAKATIVQDDGQEVRVHYDEALLGDVIDGYWKHQVRAKVRRAGATMFLEDIDDA